MSFLIPFQKKSPVTTASVFNPKISISEEIEEKGIKKNPKMCWLWGAQWHEQITTDQPYAIVTQGTSA